MAISERRVDQQLAALGSRLRAVRLRANMTQKALAELTGISLKTVGNAEDGGRVSLETFVRLLDGLDRLDELSGLLSAADPGPVEMLRRQGRRRQRARAKTGEGSDRDWKW